jgi:hypothetical protein
LYKQELEKDWKISILYHEELVLSTLRFDLDTELPYDHLEELVKKELEIDSKLASYSWYIANDSFSSDICLRFNPRQIALGSIYSVCMLLEQSLPIGKDGRTFFLVCSEPETVLKGKVFLRRIFIKN